MTVTFPYSSAPIRQIKEIQFGVMSPEEIVSPIFPYMGFVGRPCMGDCDGAVLRGKCCLRNGNGESGASQADERWRSD